MTKRTPPVRIALSPITRADGPRLFRWINDRDLVLFSAAYHPVHEKSHVEWMRSLKDREDAVAFAIRLKRGKKLIGICQLTGISRVHRSADLQIRIGYERSRGRGLGREAVRLLVDFAFRDLNLHRVSLQVFRTNARAIRAYEQAGFVREGTLREAAHVDGRYVDVLVMAVLRDETTG